MNEVRSKMHYSLQGQKVMRLISFLVFVAALGSTQTKKSALPVARQDNVKEMIHGVEIVDPYRWLEDQQSPETRKWLQQEDAYTHSMLDGLPVRDRAFQRLWAMANHDSMSAPYIENGYYFFSRRGAGQDLSKIYRRKGVDGQDELLLDPLPMSPDHTTSIGTYIASQDARLMIYSIRRGGEDETELHILDLQTHQDLPDVMPRGFYLNVNWKKDASGFFYAKSDREIGKRIYYHKLAPIPPLILNCLAKAMARTPGSIRSHLVMDTICWP